MIPYANATLTAINAPGFAEDYDTPAVAGTARWTGTVGIYCAEELTQIEGSNVDELIQTRLEIPSAIGTKVQRGDVMVYTYNSATRTRLARNIIQAPIVGRVRVTLETG